LRILKGKIPFKSTKPNDFRMNLIRPILVLFIILLGTGCASTKESFDFEEDSYFTLAKAWEAERKSREMVLSTAPQPTEPQTQENQPLTQQGFLRDEFGNIIIREGDAPQAFAEDQYHDFAYAARVRRFGETSGGWNYYDPFYTNQYWYDPQPGFFGQSIYTTYSWWGCAPLSPWQSSFSWFQPYPSWHGQPWMYGPGFNHMGGWGWAGIVNHPGNALYYNSFDVHSHYNGPRKFNRGDNQTTGPIIMSRVAPSHGVTPRPREPVRLSALPITRTPASGIDRSSRLPNTELNPVRQPTQPNRTDFPNMQGSSQPVRTTTSDLPVRGGNTPGTELPRPGTRTRYDNSSDNGLIRDVPSRSPENNGVKWNDNGDRRVTPSGDGGRRRETFQEGSRSPSWTRPASTPTKSSPPRYSAPTRSTPNPSPRYTPTPSPSRPSPGRSSSPSSPNSSPRSSSPRSR
jgi:hypothetical protein